MSDFDLDFYGQMICLISHQSGEWICPLLEVLLKGDEQETLELTWTERQEYMFVNVDFKEIMRMAKPHFPALELSCCSYEKDGI